MGFRLRSNRGLGRTAWKKARSDGEEAKEAEGVREVKETEVQKRRVRPSKSG